MMNPGAHSPETDRPLTRAVILAVAAASLIVGAFAITTQSFGSDEAVSLLVGMSPNVSSAWHYAQTIGFTVLQAPFYHTGLFAWHKVAGGGEWTLRAFNLPWFVLAQLAFLILLRHRPKLALAACLLSAVNPAVWLYLDEARPYIMQYAAACWLTAAIVRSALEPVPSMARESRIALLGAGVALVLLFGTGWGPIAWAVGFALALVWLRLSASQTDADSLAPTRSVIRICFALAVLLAAYQFVVWPGLGSGDSGLKQFVQGTIYVAYELLGFSGFGPGRLELRQSPLRSMVRQLPMMLPLAICLGLTGVFTVRRLMQGACRRILIAWLLAIAFPSAVILGACLFLEARPTPRDFIPALPGIVLFLAAAMVAALGQKSLLFRAVTIAIPILWLASGLNLRWRQSYAKDDYRAAAAVISAALRQSKEVWWAADAAAAFIYFTPVSMTETAGRAWAMQSPPWDDIRFKLPPRVIVISRPDIFDRQGAVARYASENHFVPSLRLRGIVIMTRENDPLPRVKSQFLPEGN